MIRNFLAKPLFFKLLDFVIVALLNRLKELLIMIDRRVHEAHSSTLKRMVEVKRWLRSDGNCNFSHLC